MGRTNLKLRIITGTLYFAVLVGFFFLKILVNKLFFDALIVAFGIVGTYEMLRAFGDKIHVSQKLVVLVFSVLVLVVYAISDYIYTDYYHIRLPEDSPLDAVGRNYAPHFMLVMFVAGLSILFGLLVFSHRHVTLESTGYALLSYMYPTVFLVVLIVCNHLEMYSDVAIAFVFGISPCADMFAYFFGRSFGKKLPAKMAPNISPNKTVIGGFGGLLGGAIGAILVFFVYYGFCKAITLEAGSFANVTFHFSDVKFEWVEMIFFIGIGVLTSAFSQFGDLVESAIKRKLDIKDMGNILPGHGGILDRIDSSLYASLIISLVFVVRLMLFQ